MTLKDIKTIQSFNEVVIEYVMNNLSQIQEQLKSEAGESLLNKFSGEDDQNLFEPIKSNGEELRTTQNVNQNEMRDIQLLLEYLFNLFNHVVLSFSPHQLPKFDQTMRVGNTFLNISSAIPPIFGNINPFSNFNFTN